MAQGLSLAELGARVGYSAAQVSRYERGIAPLTDIALLHRFAAVLGIPPQEFGLTPVTARHAVSAQSRSGRAGGRYVVTESRWEDGDDPVRRRDMITSSAALAGAAALRRAAGSPGTAPGPGPRLEDVLYGRIDAAPAAVVRLRVAIGGARDDFRAARYDRLPAMLPRIIATAQATSEHAASSEHAQATGLLAEAYILAADYAVKINDDPMSWMTADRALQAAQASGDALLLADARRAVATAMRRAHHPGRACDLLIRACLDIQPRRDAQP